MVWNALVSEIFENVLNNRKSLDIILILSPLFTLGDHVSFNVRKQKGI